MAVTTAAQVGPGNRSIGADSGRGDSGRSATASGRLPPTGFISYAHDDIHLLHELQKHLKTVERVLGAAFWADTQLDAGRHWRPELQRRIDAAQVFLLLASHHYFASDFINNHEYPAIVARLHTPGTLAIPVILLPCGWVGMLGHMQAVPTVDGGVRPIERWTPPHDGYDRAREQIQDSLKVHFGLEPRIRGVANPLEAVGQDPAGVLWMKQGDQLARDNGGVISDAAIATDPQVTRLHENVSLQATHFAQTAARLGNTPGWSGIDRAAQRLAQAVQLPAADLQGTLATVYDAIAAVASYRDMDQRLRSGSPGTADPLDAETAREIGRLVDAAAIWIRQYPSMRALDDALLGWRGAGLQRAEAAALMHQAREKRVVSTSDADGVATLLEAGAHDGQAGDKAAARGVLGVRNLLYRGGGLLAAEELSGKDAGAEPKPSDAPLRPSLLGRRLRDLLDAAAPQITRFVADLPPEVRQAFAHLLAHEPIGQGEVQRDDGPPAPPDRPDDQPPPPAPPADFDSDRVIKMLQAGEAVPIAWVPFITNVNLSGRGISDLGLIAGLTALQILTLWDMPVSDISPLAGLTALQSLNLQGTRVSDVSPLAGLTALQTLILWGTPVSDVSPLVGLTALQILNLGGTPVSDMPPLAGLTALQDLILWGTRVSDVSPLAGLTALQSLNLGSTPVSDVSPLAGLTALQSLDLVSTRVSDVSPLAGLTALRSLKLRGTPVSDVSPLAGITALRSLDLTDTRVSDVSPLAGLTALQGLDLWGTQVSDVSPLAGVRQLTIRGGP